ncbi:UNVERIFIED_CONTAM: hypothetical protein PYX00_003468 [Menopon gallinae]|uniref:Protein msta n=1 Tax=Menopon gallinae TaxID=328185 RepID=A0AAW2I1L8_9NEOP
MSSESLVCATCQKPSHLRCGGCHKVAYCSKEHQKIDWKIHKKKCNFFQIDENELLGRFFVSAAEIREGDVIFEEEPLVSGPLQSTPPVCLGCYVLLNELNRRDCSKCGWPVCSERCEKSDSHKPECEITERYKKEKVVISNLGNGLNHPSYESMIVLRCLYLKQANKSAWEKLSKLESHNEKRKNTEKYKSDVLMIGQFIPRFYKYGEFTEEEILKVAGIVQVNAHHVPLQDPGYVSIYERASLLEHSCRANCSKSFTREGRIVIRAARTIQKGEHLSISYTEPLLGILARREHLLDTKYFLCQCERCTDPTELGTNFNSLKCLSKDCHGYMTPLLRSVVPVGSMWRCSACEQHASKEDLQGLFRGITRDLSKLERTDPESCKRFLNDYGRYLHRNNHFIVTVKLSLIQCFDGERLLAAGWEDLQLVINTCRELIELACRLVPAENRLRGVLHFHLHAAQSEFDRRRTTLGELDDATIQNNLMTCRDILTQAYTFLKSEPEVLPEGKMAAEALKYIQDINKILKKNQLF